MIVPRSDQDRVLLSSAGELVRKSIAPSEPATVPAHATPWMLVRDRFCHQHRLSDYIGPCIPNWPISHKHAVGVLGAQGASMPRQRLRSIPRRSKSAKVVLGRVLINPALQARLSQCPLRSES